MFSDKLIIRVDISNQNTNHAMDEAAFEQLFRTHYKGMCFFAMRYVKDFDTAKEIVQEAFVALWEKRDNIDSSRIVKSYLSMIVKNKCLNWLRDNNKFNKDILEFEGLMGEDNYDTSDMLVLTELEKKISDAIAELPEKCREVFIMNRQQQLKYQEIADRLHISVKTVESHMSKALQHLRINLKEYLPLALLLLDSYYKSRI